MNEFVDPTTHGVFQGHQYNATDVIAVEMSQHVPTEYETRIDLEIDEHVKRGSLARRSDVAGVVDQPRLRMLLPLGVDPSKTQLSWTVGTRI